ncbi:MAG: FAD-binding protein, partial [Victivallales bacterium]|nr:FAD-binding protein [Victivallales bacterium]
MMLFSHYILNCSNIISYHMKQMDHNVDIIVAGGGLGGLTAANRLAQSGHKVLLVEQHSM